MADGTRAVLRDGKSKGQCFLKSLAGCTDAVGQTELEGFFCTHLPGREDEVRSPGSTHKVGEPHDSAVVRHEAKPHLGETDHGFGIHYPQVTAGGDLGSTAVSQSVNGGNDRYRQRDKTVGACPYAVDEVIRRAFVVTLHCGNSVSYTHLTLPT